MLCETIKYVNKKDIGAFYRTANRKFVIALKEVELKDLHSHEINFKGKVGDTGHVFGIFPLPPRRENKHRRRNLPNVVSVIMFLPTTVSDNIVKKGFFRISGST